MIAFSLGLASTVGGWWPGERICGVDVSLCDGFLELAHLRPRRVGDTEWEIRLAGFRVTRGAYSVIPLAYYRITLPCFVSATLLGLFPLALWLRHYALTGSISTRRPERDGADSLCPRCKYNLTGNESGRCPECGCPIQGKSIGPSG